MKIEALTFNVSESIGTVSAELIEPPSMKAMLVLAHGAGANMHHRFMKSLAMTLAREGIGTLRYNFPYMEKQKKRPDPPAIAELAVLRAMTTAHELYPNARLFAGGKSFGGRMTSQLMAKKPPAFVKGLIFFGFPLHAPGKPSTDRAQHLGSVQVPMLFLQGTRDALADFKLISDVTSRLPATTLQPFEGADHSFKAGTKELVPALASHTSTWMSTVV